jgi:hypothetical protein
MGLTRKITQCTRRVWNHPICCCFKKLNGGNRQFFSLTRVLDFKKCPNFFKD